MENNAVAPANDKPAVPKIRAARLDARGVYQGMEEFDSAEELTPLHLANIPECDLPAGKYRWNPQSKAFEALARSSVRPAPDVPSIEDVVYELALTLGDKASADVVRWMDWFKGQPR